MNAFPITFRDNTTNEITICEANEADAPLVLVFPALGVRASYYKDLIQTIASQGMHASVVDWRGNGASSIRPSRKIDFGYANLIQDMKEIIDTLSSQFPNSKKILLGHSMGGQLGCLVSAKYPKLLDGVVLTACCSVYYKGWKGFAGTRIYYFTHLINLISGTLGYYPGNKLGFGGREARTLMKDWGINGRTGNYILANDDFNYESALSKTQIPVLAINIKGDPLAPVAATKNLCNKFSDTSPIQYEVVSKEDTDNKSINHFTWAKQSKYIIGLIKNWMSKDGFAKQKTK